MITTPYRLLPSVIALWATLVLRPTDSGPAWKPLSALGTLGESESGLLSLESRRLGPSLREVAETLRGMSNILGTREICLLVIWRLMACLQSSSPQLQNA